MSSWLLTLAITAMMLIMLKQDLQDYKISNLLLLITLVLSLLWRGHLASPLWASSTATGALLFAICLPFWRWRKLGAGDVKLMFVIGFLLGWQGLPAMLVCLLALSMILSVCLKLTKHRLMFHTGALASWLQTINRQGFIPYAVVLIPATLLPWWWLVVAAT